MQRLLILCMGIILEMGILLSSGVDRVFAEDISSVGIATYMSVNENVEDGDIVSTNAKGYGLSSKAYDSAAVGIVAKKPAIALKTDTDQEGIPIVNVGTAIVKVTGTNGDIKKGDFIATSDKKGVGMKATRSGYIIGQALEDIVFKNKTDILMLAVNLNLHFLQIGSPVSSSLSDIFNISQMAAYEEPLKVFKYVISAGVLILSFVFGFLVFSRAINTGIQALGRNPLAGRMIQLSIIFNVILVIIIIMSAIGIVWLFLRL